jgi:hypothetical protein
MKAEMPDTITIARAELQQLLELVGIIEHSIKYIGKTNPYEGIEQCVKVTTKILNKTRGLLTAPLR